MAFDRLARKEQARAISGLLAPVTTSSATSRSRSVRRSAIGRAGAPPPGSDSQGPQPLLADAREVPRPCLLGALGSDTVCLRRPAAVDLLEELAFVQRQHDRVEAPAAGLGLAQEIVDLLEGCRRTGVCSGPQGVDPPRDMHALHIRRDGTPVDLVRRLRLPRDQSPDTEERLGADDVELALAAQGTGLIRVAASDLDMTGDLVTCSRSVEQGQPGNGGFVVGDPVVRVRFLLGIRKQHAEGGPLVSAGESHLVADGPRPATDPSEIANADPEFVRLRATRSASAKSPMSRSV